MEAQTVLCSNSSQTRRKCLNNQRLVWKIPVRHWRVYSRSVPVRSRNLNSDFKKRWTWNSRPSKSLRLSSRLSVPNMTALPLNCAHSSILKINRELTQLKFRQLKRNKDWRMSFRVSVRSWRQLRRELRSSKASSILCSNSSQTKLKCLSNLRLA